ncbi:hypothetical protein J6590_036007 [Homalodisca vitripennis]|nr:hypothetical protein J6590_036007 [Homalodisca vitripennis]
MILDHLALRMSSTSIPRVPAHPGDGLDHHRSLPRRAVAAHAGNTIIHLTISTSRQVYHPACIVFICGSSVTRNATSHFRFTTGHD